ncbi:unnamed protein product [Parascedosporium putredinis]|uniref:Uncharacterized protein n=1 Tax=Parascedosporium putredinis TaxID=1442378 RepID=A0A9P1H095_9PEZI|nr:unnamed protein product [Parascedosporium putredinis]CAI7991876.1 unnamed protein product [Parascedosporium putredinis]
MAPVKTNDVLQVPAYSQDSESAATEISWSQNLRTRTARYYIVQAKNTSQNNEDVPLYVQDRFYKDQDSNDFISKLPGAKREGDNWVVPIGDRFQYGQRTTLARAAGFVSMTRKISPTNTDSW